MSIKKYNIGIKMHPLIVLGIIIIAIGTFILYLGSMRQSNQVNEEIQKKLNMTSDKIDSLKKDPGINKESINEIDDEFNSWAKDFTNNKNAHQLNFEKENLDIQKKQNDLSIEWRPMYIYFTQTLKNLLDAFNQNNDWKIVYSIPELPNNLFSEEFQNYVIKLKFNDRQSMLMAFFSSRSTALPNIYIANIYNKNIFEKEKKYSVTDVGLGGLTISPDIEVNEIRIYIIEHYYPLLKLKGDYSLKDYEKSIKEILKTIIEYKIVMVEKGVENNEN